MQEAQAISSGALNQQVMHVVLLAGKQRIALFPVAAHTHNRLRNLINRYDVWQLNSSLFAVFILVLKAADVQINQKLQQTDFFFHTSRINACCAVCFLLDNALACLCRSRHLRCIQVLTTDHCFAVIVGGHRNAVRDPLAFAHHRRAGVRNIKVIRQHQSAYHAALGLVVIDFLECRATKTNIEQQLIKVRCVLFHHCRDLVVHEVPHAIRLHQLLTCFLAQHLRAHRTACGHQFLERLGLELNNTLCQKWVLHAARALERLGTLFKREAQHLHALAVLLFPLFA